MSAKVSVNLAKISRTMDDLVSLAIEEVSTTLVDIADDAEANAEAKWYTQVRKKTGKTGQLRTRLRHAGANTLEAIVESANEPDKTTYMVHRPGPLSMRRKKVTASEYAEIMSFFRANGHLPEGVHARAVAKDGQPMALVRDIRNPLASDGKNLWSELGRKEGKKIILARVDDMDAAMQRAADRLRQR